MISNAFQVIAKQLDDYFVAAPSRTFHGSDNASIVTSDSRDNDPHIKIVSFLQQEDKQEYIKFPLNKVTPILINIEEEGSLRAPDHFSRISVNGNREPIYPDVRLNLYILFVSHFYDYTDALYYLGLIVKYFQTHPILDHQNTPDLHQEIDKLIIELKTLPISEQNEIWNALRSAYHPSLLYRVKMLVFQDRTQDAPDLVKGIQIDTGDFE